MKSSASEPGLKHPIPVRLTATTEIWALDTAEQVTFSFWMLSSKFWRFNEKLIYLLPIFLYFFFSWCNKPVQTYYVLLTKPSLCFCFKTFWNTKNKLPVKFNYLLFIQVVVKTDLMLCFYRFPLSLYSILVWYVLIHFATKPRTMSRDELREVEVQVRGNENEAQHGHQISMKDRDPTAMNDHVKVNKPTTQALNLTR